MMYSMCIYRYVLYKLYIYIYRHTYLFVSFASRALFFCPPCQLGLLSPLSPVQAADFSFTEPMNLPGADTRDENHR